MNSVGKDASDITSVIDAVDLLRPKRLGGFYLMPPDGEFIQLSAYPGETHRRFQPQREQDAGQLLTRLQTLHLHRTSDPTWQGRTGRQGKPDLGDAAKAIGLPTTAAAALSETAFEQLDDQAGSQFLRSVGQRLIAPTPDFNPRNRGCAKRVTLSEKMGTFDVGQDGSKAHNRPHEAA